MAIGKWSQGAQWVYPPSPQAFVYALRGYQGGSGLCQLQFTWATGEAAPWA